MVYNDGFTAEMLATLTAIALGVKVKWVTLGVEQIGGGEWNFNELQTEASKKTGMKGSEEQSRTREFPRRRIDWRVVMQLHALPS